MSSLKRYQSLHDSFSEKIECNENRIIFDEKSLNLIGDLIPDFTFNNSDNFTNKMSSFYNEVKFPNYDDFDDYASLYDKGIKNSFTRRLDDELNYGSKVLELGCGTGQLSLFLARGNRQIYGVDISNGSLILGEKFRKENEIKNAYFMKMDVFDLKFKKNNFDFTISNGVLHHTKDPHQAFKLLVEVTKPGGLIAIGLYHKYGRFFTTIKQQIAKLVGKNIFILDKTSLKIDTKEKRESWVVDQFFNPHETLHSPIETLKWFDEEGIEFINLIPHLDKDDLPLFKKRDKPKLSLISELSMIFNRRQIQEGGFFIIIGRKN